MDQKFSRDEARMLVLEYLTRGWKGEIIKAELIANNGDPARAVKNVSAWASEHLGNHGCANDAFRCTVYGTVKSIKGASVWYGDLTQHWKDQPDEIITWREIFGYMAGESQQLSLL
jgi:hypothetical protein